GINFIDTAAGYGAGHSEEVVGRAVKGERDRWVIETKGGEGWTADNRNWKDFSRARLLAQIDESLTRLDTDHVDVYLLHGPSDEDIEKGECLQALKDIKSAGKSRLVGISLGPAAMGLGLIDIGLIDVYQVSISITDTGMADALLPAAAEAGIGIVARGAMGAGFYTGRVSEATAFSENDRRSTQSQDSMKSRAAVASAFAFLEKPARSTAQSCIKFVLAHPEVSTVIPGSKDVTHMLENAAASEAPDLTEDELTEIARIREGLKGS
ncbi:MAG: aldo/keto reductase, partial [Candidatus Latescibacteria bacterium]|nr:aldo/keto reductase [Candidatus Latescibacterota bacterium]